MKSQVCQVLCAKYISYVFFRGEGKKSGQLLSGLQQCLFSAIFLCPQIPVWREVIWPR